METVDAEAEAETGGTVREAVPARTMAGARASAAAGLRAGWRQRRLVLLVWLAFFALAAFAAVPTWRACDSALSHAPEGDRLLPGLNLPLLREIGTTDGQAASAMTWPVMLAASVVVALLWNPFVSGGVLTVLLEDERARRVTVRERFLAGGARHYGRLAWLLALALPIGAVLLALAGAVLFGIAYAVGERNLERTSLALWIADLVLLAGFAGLLSLIVDFARIHIVRDGVRAWRALRGAARLVIRHPIAPIGFGLTFALLLGAGAVLYFALTSAMTFTTWALILLGIVLQQAFAIARTGLRVAMIAGELHMLPAPPPTPPPSPPSPPPPATEPVPAPVEAAPPRAAESDSPEPPGAPDPSSTGS